MLSTQTFYYCVLINTPRMNHNLCREMLQVLKLGTWVLSSNQLIGNCISASIKAMNVGREKSIGLKHHSMIEQHAQFKLVNTTC